MSAPMSQELIELAELRGRMCELLSYNPVTGHWTRLVDRGPAKAGDRAGSVNKRGYEYIMVDGVSYKSSRLAFLYMLGRWPIGTADHCNRVRGYDAWNNLRDANYNLQSRNKGLMSTNTSGCTGVFADKKSGKFQAQITINDKKKHLGMFTSKLEAQLARAHAEMVIGDYPGNAEMKIQDILSSLRIQDAAKQEHI